MDRGWCSHHPPAYSLRSLSGVQLQTHVTLFIGCPQCPVYKYKVLQTRDLSYKVLALVRLNFQEYHSSSKTLAQKE